MDRIDANIVIIALPSIVSDTHVSLITLVWTVLGYSLVTASILLNLGRLSKNGSLSICLFFIFVIAFSYKPDMSMIKAIDSLTGIF